MIFFKYFKDFKENEIYLEKLNELQKKLKTFSLIEKKSILNEFQNLIESSFFNIKKDDNEKYVYSITDDYGTVHEYYASSRHYTLLRLDFNNLIIEAIKTANAKAESFNIINLLNDINVRLFGPKSNTNMIIHLRLQNYNGKTNDANNYKETELKNSVNTYDNEYFKAKFFKKLIDIFKNAAEAVDKEDTNMRKGLLDMAEINREYMITEFEKSKQKQDKQLQDRLTEKKIEREAKEKERADNENFKKIVNQNIDNLKESASKEIDNISEEVNKINEILDKIAKGSSKGSYTTSINLAIHKKDEASRKVGELQSIFFEGFKNIVDEDATKAQKALSEAKEERKQIQDKAKEIRLLAKDGQKVAETAKREAEEAAVKIQAVARGHADRKKAAAKRREAAAVKIQARIRGFAVQKEAATADRKAKATRTQQEAEQAEQAAEAAKKSAEKAQSEKVKVIKYIESVNVIIKNINKAIVNAAKANAADVGIVEKAKKAKDDFLKAKDDFLKAKDDLLKTIEEIENANATAYEAANTAVEAAKVPSYEKAKESAIKAKESAIKAEQSAEKAEKQVKKVKKIVEIIEKINYNISKYTITPNNSDNSESEDEEQSVVPINVCGYLTDVEGNLDYFHKYVALSEILEWADEAKSKLRFKREDAMFVFGGDSQDKGDCYAWEAKI